MDNDASGFESVDRRGFVFWLPTYFSARRLSRKGGDLVIRLLGFTRNGFSNQSSCARHKHFHIIFGTFYRIHAESSNLI